MKKRVGSTAPFAQCSVSSSGRRCSGTAGQPGQPGTTLPHGPRRRLRSASAAARSPQHPFTDPPPANVPNRFSGPPRLQFSEPTPQFTTAYATPHLPPVQFEGVSPQPHHPAHVPPAPVTAAPHPPRLSDPAAPSPRPARRRSTPALPAPPALNETPRSLP